MRDRGRDEGRVAGREPAWDGAFMYVGVLPLSDKPNLRVSHSGHRREEESIWTQHTQGRERSYGLGNLFRGELRNRAARLQTAIADVRLRKGANGCSVS